MSVYRSIRDPTFLFFCIAVMALFFLTMPIQQTEGIAKETSVLIQEGHPVDLTDLKGSVILPNGMTLEDVSFVEEGFLAGTIQTKKVFFEKGEGLRMVWLDKKGNSVGHTFLNNPPFGATSGEKLGIWPLFGASQVKFEVWE